ncbi:hypothetical protein PEC18_35915 [Paucibacter sp. O1-1]|nr:hypothetical protein [Paucibacter sp. O1-1]MDA3831045.1 hypothetical protein [Paucibacter sp. O1-1]
MAEQVTPQDWFTYTKQGLDFFDSYFGIDYPFKKVRPGAQCQTFYMAPWKTPLQLPFQKIASYLMPK